MVVNRKSNFSFMPKWSDARNERNSLAVQLQAFHRQTAFSWLFSNISRLTEILFNCRHLYKFNTPDGSQLLWRWLAALAHGQVTSSGTKSKTDEF